MLLNLILGFVAALCLAGWVATWAASAGKARRVRAELEAAHREATQFRQALGSGTEEVGSLHERLRQEGALREDYRRQAEQNARWMRDYLPVFLELFPDLKLKRPGDLVQAQQRLEARYGDNQQLQQAKAALEEELRSKQAELEQALQREAEARAAQEAARNELQELIAAIASHSVASPDEESIVEPLATAQEPPEPGSATT